MSSFKPLVSVVIPVFNGASFVTKAVHSVRSQTVQDVEIIIVDDGSTDGTQEVLKDLEKRDGIQWHKQQHLGPACSRNKGIQYAKGTYVALLDCDDVWLPRKLEIQLDCLRNNSDVGLVHTDFEVVGEDGTVLERVKARYSHEPLVREFVGGHTALPSTLLIRRDLIQKVGGFNPDFYYGSEDSEFTVRLFRITRFACIEEVLVQKLKRGQESRELALDFVTHKTKVLDSRGKFLKCLEQIQDMTRKQRRALDCEWANYYIQFGGFYSKLGNNVRSRNYYGKGIGKAPFRFRLYSRWVRTFIQ